MPIVGSKSAFERVGERSRLRPTQTVNLTTPTASASLVSAATGPRITVSDDSLIFRKSCLKPIDTFRIVVFVPNQPHLYLRLRGESMACVHGACKVGNRPLPQPLSSQERGE
jgi:hypothetical protein